MDGRGIGGGVEASADMYAKKAIAPNNSIKKGVCILPPLVVPFNLNDG